MTPASNPIINPISAWWGMLGVAGLLLFAIWRLAPYAVEAVSMELSLVQWVVLIGNVVFMAWSEGYKGFQLAFSPRVAARVLYLQRHEVTWFTCLVAPVFCVGYFSSTRRTMLVAWIGTIGIISLVLVVNQFPQPWRGIVDAGVVVGLTWGLVTFIASLYKTLTKVRYYRSPEVPGAADSL